MKNKENRKIPNEKQENHENNWIPLENHEKHANLRISLKSKISTGESQKSWRS